MCPLIQEHRKTTPNLSVDLVCDWQSWIECQCDCCKFFIENQDQKVLILCPNWLPGNPYPRLWTPYPIEDNDIVLVIQQTGASRTQAIDAIRRHDGDIVDAIMELTR